MWGGFLMWGVFRGSSAAGVFGFFNLMMFAFAGLLIVGGICIVVRGR
jgi:hypothetical protein